MSLTEYRVYVGLWAFFFVIFSFFSVECGKAGDHFWEGGCAIIALFCAGFGVSRALNPPRP